MNLKKIINGAWALESFDIIRLSKYMRCLFHVAVSDNQSVAEQLLDRVQSLAEETSGVGSTYHMAFQSIDIDFPGIERTTLSPRRTRMGSDSGFQPCYRLVLWR